MARRKKQDGDPPDDADNANNPDETFGLPDIEYEPLKRDESQPESSRPEYSTQQTYSSSEPMRSEYQNQEVHNEYTNNYDDDEGGSPWAKIIGVLALLALAFGVYWFFWKYQPQRRAEAEKAKQEQIDRDAAATRAEEERKANEARLAEEQRRADSVATALPKEGTIETLTERTQRYYVVVASAIDGDLIMDQAKRLSAKGVTAKIIPPFGKTKFYRLTVADGDTYADTQATADGMKADYGDAVWVVRY
jgi:hypothetical protein